jgi:hypothetical protein
MASATRAIELYLKTPEQLFNSLDPSPFNERDLDADAERHIVGWAQEIDASAALKLVVHLPRAAGETRSARAIPHAVSHYFSYRAEQTRLELRELLRIGWRSLAIGLAVLALSFSASQYVARAMGQDIFGRLLVESLLILGWVANWRPLEIFLYGWWPIQRHRKLLNRLAAMPVELRLSDKSDHGEFAVRP